MRDVVRRYLERDGHDVAVACNGSEAMHLLRAGHVDLAVLDVMMPGPDGMTLCRDVGGAVPVIMLTALGEEDDRIAGLEAGADDYLTKPFSPRELALRVQSVLRRSPASPSSVSDVLRSDTLVVNTVARAVQADHRRIGLTAREFDLLVFLMTHPDAVHSREQLLKLVWRWDFGDLSTVTVHIKRLRAKLGDHHRVRTVWGRGYMWSTGALDEAVHHAAG